MRNKKAQLISPNEWHTKVKEQKGKKGRSIRRRIVWGYVQLYILIAFFALAIGIIAWYVTTFEAIQDDIGHQLYDILEDLPLTDDYEALHEQINQELPPWIIRYDLYLVHRKDHNVETDEFLFCKDGVGLTTEQHFDRSQCYSSVDNLAQIDRMYIISDYRHTSEDNQSNSYSVYRIKAVMDVNRFQGGWFSYDNWAAVLLSAYFLVFITGLLLVIVYGAAQTRKYLLPIQDITTLTSQLGSNNLNLRLDVDSAKYELKELVIAINAMLDRISATYVKQRHFVSDVSHELRTPISVINGYANMLKRWARDDKVVFDESVDAIIEEADNMKYLVENLLFLARSDNKTLAYEMEDFDLSAMLADIVKDTELVDNGKHHLSSSIAPEIILCGDRSRIKQAIRAFVENALKYTPPSGTIEILLDQAGQYARITVKDTGLGISKKDLGHIFRRFYRGDRSRTRKDGGYGLGLPIARAVVVAHQGKIKISSQENAGTTAAILLPLQKSKH